MNSDILARVATVCNVLRTRCKLKSYFVIVSDEFIWGFTSLSTLYRSYHDGLLEGQRKPVHTVRQGSVL